MREPPSNKPRVRLPTIQDRLAQADAYYERLRLRKYAHLPDIEPEYRTSYEPALAEVQAFDPLSRSQPHTIAVNRISIRELMVGRIAYPMREWSSYERPKTRRDCLTAARAATLNDNKPDGLPDGINCARPCPFVTCKHHLYIDVSRKTGSIHLNHPDVPLEELRPSCALDVVDAAGEDGSTLEQVAKELGITRERVRQIVTRALKRFAANTTNQEYAQLRDAHEAANERVDHDPTIHAAPPGVITRRKRKPK